MIHTLQRQIGCLLTHQRYQGCSEGRIVLHRSQISTLVGTKGRTAVTIQPPSIGPAWVLVIGERKSVIDRINVSRIIRSPVTFVAVEVPDNAVEDRLIAARTSVIVLCSDPLAGVSHTFRGLAGYTVRRSDGTGSVSLHVRTDNATSNFTSSTVVSRVDL